MNFTRKVLITVISLIMFSGAVSSASENTTCRPYTEKELNSIKASNNPQLIMGAGIVDLVISPESPVGKELLDTGSRIEYPKGVATVSLILKQMNHDYNLPLKPLGKDIRQLLQDDQNNALSYYLNALLQQEEGRDQEALALIKNGNVKNYDGYSKQRFYSIVEAAEMAKCSRVEARQYALLNSLSSSVYIKSHHLCQKLIEGYGQEAKNACFLMGQNLERTSLTIVEKLNSLGIQRISLGESPSNMAALMEIKKKREQAINCGGRTLENISETDVTEDADLRYYEIYLESGECSALEFLSNFVKGKSKGN